MKIKITLIALLLVTLVSLSANVRQHQTIKRLELRPASVESDVPYIRRAATYWAQKNGITSDRAMIDRYGKAIYFSGQACVSLELEAGGVGGVPVYCFDEQNGKLISRYDEVE